MARDHYDVCVIGSGAAGGVLATELAVAGARVMLIEDGLYRDPSQLNTTLGLMSASSPKSRS